MISWLKEWVTLIICNVVFITIVEILLPNNSLKKYCKFVLGLILIAVLINPIIKVFTNKDIVTEIENKQYLITENSIKFDTSKVQEIDKNKIIEVFNEKLAGNCEKFLSETYENVEFKVVVKSTLDEKDNKIQISSLSVDYYDKKTVKNVENIEINSNKSTSNNEKNILKEKIITSLSEELKISRNKITAKESKGVNDETN